MQYKKVLELWLENKRLDVRNSTIYNYESAIRNWISPKFGDREVEEITKTEIQDYFCEITEKYATETIFTMEKVFAMSFRWALEEGCITINPFLGVVVPKTNTVKDLNVFTEDEVKAILQSCKFEYQRDMILLSYRTGMRIGEIIALKWDDINIEQAFLMVQRTLSTYRNGKPEFGEPKTKTSRRRIDLDKASIEMLKRRKTVDSREFVFCKFDGSVYSREAIHMKDICATAGVRHRSFHAFRHTHASVLLSRGVHPKIVQERLGHAYISITLDTYSHLIPSMQKIVVEVFDNL